MSSRLRYLSDEWLAAADAAVDGLSPVATDLSVGMEISGGPDGDRGYRLILGPDRVGVAADGGEVRVRMGMNWQTAVSIAQGRTSAQRAFLDGEIRLGGDTSALLGHQAELAEFDDRLGALRDRTDYG